MGTGQWGSPGSGDRCLLGMGGVTSLGLFLPLPVPAWGYITGCVNGVARGPDTHSAGVHAHKGISAELGCSPRWTALSGPGCWEEGGAAGTLQLGSSNSGLWCLAAKRWGSSMAWVPYSRPVGKA